MQNSEEQFIKGGADQEPVSCHIPKQRDKQEKYEVTKFEKPLLLFPIKQVENLRYVHQVLSLHVPERQGQTHLLTRKVDATHSTAIVIWAILVTVVIVEQVNIMEKTNYNESKMKGRDISPYRQVLMADG